MKSILQIFALSTTLAFASGCGTTGYKKASTTSSSLQEAAQSIDDTLVPLNAVLVALEDLVKYPSEDITSQFRTYSSAVSELESSVNLINLHAEQMRSQGDSYFQNWEEELVKIQSNEIQSRSRDRKIAMANNFREVTDRYAKTRDDLQPFVSRLVDIRTALSTDLTEAGLNSLNGLLKSANRNAAALRESLVELSSDFKEMGVSLSPTMPSA